jgi:tRNA1(Val) A37 N6-methylase TrmN6
VLLAATIPARTGQHVLEGGTGAGAALLCLAARVPGLSGCGIEIDSDQTDRARDNAAANGMPGLIFIAGSVETDIPDAPFDHAFANPPYHLAPGTVSPDASRSRAKAGSSSLLEDWARALAKPLKHRGTLTFILPAASLPACLAAMAAAGCAVSAIFPLWPKAGVPAKLTIVRGVKGGRGTPSLLPGLILHTPDGRFTAEADAILRNGDALPLG